MSNVGKKYIWSFFNSAAGRIAIVTDEKDVAKAVKVYQELGYKNIDKIEFISEAYAGEKDIALEQRLQQAQTKIEQYERARQSYLQACDELEAHANQPDIVLSIVSELRQALEGTE
jgi:mevalonate kinase